MWQLPEQKEKTRRRSTNWPQIGPLGRDVGQVFSSLVYNDTSSPLPLTIVCGQDVITVLADTTRLDSNEIDIAVADQTLYLSLEAQEEALSAAASDQPTPTELDSFSHSVSLPYRVDVGQIDAGFDNDMLHITLPKLQSNLSDLTDRQYTQ